MFITLWTHLQPAPRSATRQHGCTSAVHGHPADIAEPERYVQHNTPDKLMCQLWDFGELMVHCLRGICMALPVEVDGASGGGQGVEE